MRPDRLRSWNRSIKAVAVALIAIAALAFAREVVVRLRTEPFGAPHLQGIKGDVRRGSDDRLWYFDGQRWNVTPPRPQDDSF